MFWKKILCFVVHAYQVLVRTRAGNRRPEKKIRDEHDLSFTLGPFGFRGQVQIGARQPFPPQNAAQDTSRRVKYNLFQIAIKKQGVAESLVPWQNSVL